MRRQLADAATSHSALTTASTAAKTMADVALGDMTAQLKRATDELTALKLQLADMTAAKVSLDKVNAELDRNARRSVLEIERLTRQLSELTTTSRDSKGLSDRRIGELEGQVD